MNLTLLETPKTVFSHKAHIVLSLKIDFILANIVDCDEMWYSAEIQSEFALFVGVPVLGFPVYSKTCLKRPLKNRQNKDLNGEW